ncbi:MAG: hypothetical protein JKY54_19525 [Flavobacteriales bacterium]|nr:hypothetical protein [Flavobacteriales bacterium]
MRFIRFICRNPILKLTFLGLIVFAAYSYSDIKDNRGHDHQFIADVDQYYSYLPAYFIHDDLDFNYPHSYWLAKAENGRKVPKVSMGLAILYSPFFLMADAYARDSEYARDGYSYPYSLMIRLGSLFYFLLGMIVLSKALLRFYKEYVVAITCAAIFLGTNLFYYTIGWIEMSHSYLFTLFAIIIYLTIRWHEDGKTKHILLLGFVAGFCALVRPTSVFILFVPMLYGVSGIKTIQPKIQFLLEQKWKIILAMAVFLLPLIPQVVFWKSHTDMWLFFSYGSDENFFFGNPHIQEFLIGYRKGWLLYTPLMILSIIGLFFFREKAKKFRLATPIILILTIYVFSSWWSWWYGGSFGMRAMIQYYAILAFPLAAFISVSFKKWMFGIPVALAVVFCVQLNLKQSLQYRRNHIHWDGMTKEAYWYVIEHPKFVKKDWAEFKLLLDEPDYAAAKEGKDP